MDHAGKAEDERKAAAFDDLYRSLSEAVALMERFPTDPELYPDEAKWLSSAKELLAKVNG